MKKNLFFWFILQFIFLPIALAGEPVEVARVLDAQTLKLNDGRTVHLLGVNTPQVNAPEQNKKMAERNQTHFETLQLFSFISRNFVKELVEGERVMLSLDSANASANHRDGQGRLLAYVWFRIKYKENNPAEDADTFMGITGEDRLLNAEIIKGGYGFADRDVSFIYQKEFVHQEKLARENRRGLWNPKPLDYEEILEMGRGALSASVSDLLPQDARQVSLESARRAFTRAIDLNPKDYRAFYERSWLGVNPFHRQMSSQNLQDIDRAILLAPHEPKCYAQKHYLLRILGTHRSAVEAYKMAARFLAKQGSPAAVSAATRQADISKQVGDVENFEEVESFAEDAYRAGLNEQHFLFFVARYKGLKFPAPDKMKSIYQDMYGQKQFLKYEEKYRGLLNSGSPSEIIYTTAWSIRGWQEPEDVLKGMEKVERNNAE